MLSALLLAGLVVTSAHAGVVYNEPVNGDVSDNRLAPTAIALALGNNSFFGVISGIRLDDTIDRDYFTITIPAGQRLESITLDNYISSDQAAFIGVAPGSTFPFAPDDVGPEDLLGFALFGGDLVGQDLLAVIGINGTGFTGGLGAGTYTFWVQQIGPPTEYSLNFTVVPTPAAAGLLALGAITSMSRRRRR